MSDDVRVLLLDGDASDAEVNERELRRAGLRCTTRIVSDYDAFARALGEWSPELILSGYALPGFDGIEALRLARRHDPDVAFVVVTCSTTETTLAECMRAGADDYVLKDDIGRLALVVPVALNKRRARVDARRAHAALRGSEAHMRAIVETATDAIVTADARGHITTFNPAAERLFGYSAADVVGSDIAQLMPTPHAAAHSGYVARYLETGDAHVVGRGREIEARCRDGTLVPVWLSVSEFNLGQERTFVGILRDLRELQRADAALRRSEERYRELVEHATDGIVCIDEHARIVLFNRAAERMFGLEAEAALGRDAFTLFPGERGQLLRRDLAQHLATGQSKYLGRTNAWEGLRSTGESFPVEVSVSASRSEDGSTIFMGLVRDVSERRHAEDEIGRLYRALEQSPVGVVITDVAGHIQYVNACFTEVTGYTRAEVSGQTPHILKSGEHPPEFYRELWATIGTGGTWRGRMANRRKDGGLVWVDTVIAPVTGEHGNATHFIAIQRDVTDEQRRAEEVERWRARLEMAQRAEATARLAGGIAHDFNNLLGVIIGYGEIVLRRSTPTDPVFAKVDQMVRAAVRGAELTRQLLAFSRKQVLQPVILDPNALIADFTRMLGRLIGEDVDLQVEAAPDVGRVRADRSQLEQVLMNLAINARDAMPAGGTLTIQTSNQDLAADDPSRLEPMPAGSYVRLRVRDTGVGIAEDALPHVFEPFFTTKPLGKGTGLGLATVYGIVKQSGGYVWAHNAPGGGAVMDVLLPRADGDPEQPRPHNHALPAAVRSGATVLLVEDNAPLRALNRETLEEAGYNVIEAADGDTALEMLRLYSDRVDVLLTDIVLPRRGGSEIAAAAARHAHIRVLFTSGYTGDDDGVRRVLDAGLAFLPKPASALALLKAVGELLGSDARRRPE